MELEAKAKEFEVLSSVNLTKILTLLENKEHKISSLTKTGENLQDMISTVHRMKEQEIQLVKLRAQEESKYKVEAMTKLEALRQEMQAYKGSEPQNNSVQFWRDQCQNLFDICRNLKEDNEKLVDHIGNNPNPNDWRYHEEEHGLQTQETELFNQHAQSQSYNTIDHH